MSSKFNEYTPKNEDELHEFIENGLQKIEDGLDLIEHEMDLGGPIPDFLCVDSGSKLTIIEVKLTKDRYIFWQGIEYFHRVDKNKHLIAHAYKEKNIDPSQEPRIILVAKDFSDDTIRACDYFNQQVDLFTYKVIKYENMDKGILFFPVDIPSIPTISLPTTVKDHEDYITREELKSIFNFTREKIKEIDSKNLKEYAKKSYIAYSYKNKIIAGIKIRRKYFEIIVNYWDEKVQTIIDHKNVKIEKGEDDYNDILNQISVSLTKVKERY